MLRTLNLAHNQPFQLETDFLTLKHTLRTPNNPRNQFLVFRPAWGSPSSSFTHHLGLFPRLSPEFLSLDGKVTLHTVPQSGIQKCSTLSLFWLIEDTHAITQGKRKGGISALALGF